MGIKDVLSGSGGTEDAPVLPDEPGGASSQLDGEGRGPVTLDDRTRPGGQGSPDTNQGKAEPMPATPGQADPAAALEPPLLEDMNVGGGDPQSPSHGLARDRDLPVAAAPQRLADPGAAPQDERPAIDPGSAGPLPEGPERPAQASAGTAQRAPGSNGESPEQQETDVDTGAANMRPGGSPGPSDAGPGDAQTVPVPHEVAAEGTSETASVATGIRAPQQSDD